MINGKSVLAHGSSEDGGWWVVAVSPSIAPAVMGWVSAAYVTTTNTEGVPVVAPPPATVKQEIGGISQKQYLDKLRRIKCQKLSV